MIHLRLAFSRRCSEWTAPRVSSRRLIGYSEIHNLVQNQGGGAGPQRTRSMNFKNSESKAAFEIGRWCHDGIGVGRVER
jgi:hypothetical protein